MTTAEAIIGTEYTASANPNEAAVMERPDRELSDIM
jgi:hypothetical protein